MKWRDGVMVCLASALMALPALAGRPQASPKKAEVLYPVGTAVSPALRSIAPDTCKSESATHHVIPNQAVTKQMSAAANEGGPPDSLVKQRQPAAAMPSPLLNMDGIANLDGVAPPDTEGDIGPNEYVQWINSHIQGWTINRSTWTATTAFGPVAANTLWAPLGGTCAADNWGDPIVLWDRFRTRWVISQFDLGSSGSGPFKIAIAVSQTPDPAGAWYLYCYDFSASVMNDYPKFGVWPDGYYMTCNQFAGNSWDGAGVAVFEASKMVTGDPTARMLKLDLGTISLNYGNILPAHFEGMNNPPAGSPDCLVEVDDSTWWTPSLPSDMISLWKVSVDWTAGTMTVGSSGAPNLQIPIADFTPLCIGTRSCIPQPAGGENLDALGDRAMYRCQYRNFGSYESMVFNITVNAGGGQAGIRWFELRKDSAHADWYLYQEGTYAPADSIHRWLASAAQDHMGNLALGYSMSSSTTKPSIGYVGRLAGDPADSLPQSETVLFSGPGVQDTGYSRWGDYSTMSVDPTDDCTLWYTQEYALASGGWDWATRIGAFKFANCSIGPTGTLNGTVTASAGGAPIVGATISATDGVSTIQTQTGVGGVYTMTVPVSTYNVTASAFGYGANTANGVAVTNGGTTTQNFSLVSAGTHTISGTVSDGTTSWPLYAAIHIAGDMGYPGTTIYTNPSDGYYSITLVDGVTYAFTVTPWVSGYSAGAATVGPLSADSTQDFSLSVANACGAPGYIATGFLESFDSITPPTLPGGWATAVVAGSGPVWSTNAGTHYPNGVSAHSAPNLVYFNSWSVSSGAEARLYRTSGIDLNVTGTSLSFWMYHDSGYSSDADGVQVQVSTDGGATWQNVGSFIPRYDGTVQWTQHTVTLAGFTGPANNVRLGFLGVSAYGNDVHLDDIQIGTPGCNAPTGGGLIFGQAYDANTGNVLAGATVVNATTGGSAITAATPDPNMADGFYCLYGAEGANAMTASKPTYGTDAQTATVPHYGAVQQDFHLATGHLAASPAALEITLPSNSTGTQALTLQNVGGADVHWKVLELADHVSAPSGNLFAKGLTRPSLTKSQMMTRAFMQEMAEEREEKAQEGGKENEKDGHHDLSMASSADRAPAAKKPGSGVPAASSLKSLLPSGVNAYAIDLSASGALVAFDPATPGTFTTIGTTGLSLFGGHFYMGDFTKMYCLDYDNNQLDTVNTTTAAVSVIGPAMPVSGDSWSGLTCSNTGTMYACSTNITTSTLYTLDPATGTATVVGEITNAPGIIDIAINPAGQLYGLDIVNDVLVSINPATGAGTVVGAIGFPANYAQGMSFEETSGTLYIAAYNYDGSSGQGELRTCDTGTGATTLIGAFQGGDEVDCLSFATFVPADIPWIDEDIKSGTVPASGSQAITVSYDTTGLAEGDYLATLSFNNDTPYGKLNVPVTLHVVNCPASISFAPSVLPAGNTRSAYNQTITATSTPPGDTFTFTVTAGSLPPGLSLSTAGVLTGTPTLVGTFTFTVTATDPVGCTGSHEYTLSVSGYDMSFRDDNGRSSVCLNSKTGDWQYTVLSGAGRGVYTGTGTVSKTTDRITFRSSAGSSRLMLVTYYPQMFKATGSYGGSDFVSQLSDRNTKDTPFSCSGH